MQFGECHIATHPDLDAIVSIIKALNCNAVFSLFLRCWLILFIFCCLQFLTFSC